MAYRQENCNNIHGVSTGISSDDATGRSWGAALVLAETRSVQAQTIVGWHFWEMIRNPAGGDQ